MEVEPTSSTYAKSPQRWVAALERVKTQKEETRPLSDPGTNEHEFSSMDQRMQYHVARRPRSQQRGGGRDTAADEKKNQDNEVDTSQQQQHLRRNNIGGAGAGNTLTEAAFQAAIRSRQEQQQPAYGAASTAVTSSVSSFRHRMLERHRGGLAQTYSQYRIGGGEPQTKPLTTTTNTATVASQEPAATPTGRNSALDRRFSRQSLLVDSSRTTTPVAREDTTKPTSGLALKALRSLSRSPGRTRTPAESLETAASFAKNPPPSRLPVQLQATSRPSTPSDNLAQRQLPVRPTTPLDNLEHNHVASRLATQQRQTDFRPATPSDHRSAQAPAVTPSPVTEEASKTKRSSRSTTPTRSNSGRLQRDNVRWTTPQIPVRQQPDQLDNSVKEDEIIDLPSVVHQIDDRAEIETPSPARVSDLRQKLWTENEHLRVQWMKHRNQTASTAKLKTALGSQDEGLRFKERYRNAAARRGIVNGENGVHGETVDALIAKLGTVNREDPEAALAQIDEILRKQTQVEQLHSPKHRNDEDDVSSSVDSTVSSITDPTYEELSKARLKEGASALAKGRMRPSALAKYSTPVNVVNGSLGSSRLRPPRNHRGVFPTSLELATVEPNENKEPTKSIAGRSFVQIKRDRDKEDDIREEDVSGSGILDTATDELEQKIRRWDELSTGIIPSTTSDNPSPVEKLGNNAAHPWEGTRSPKSPGLPAKQPATSVINVRETTMDSADGIEAEYAISESKTIHQETSVNSARTLRKERLSREQRPATIVEEVTDKELDHARKNDAFDDFLPVFDPRQEKAKAMADDYDSAWINLPESKYFGHTPRKQVSNESFRQSNLIKPGTKGFPDSHLQHLPDGEVEVGYMNMDSIDAYQAIYAGNRNMTGRPEEISSDARRERSDKALKGFLSRTTRELRRGDHLTYTSTGSRRYRDLKAKLEANEQREQRIRANSNLGRARSLDERRETVGGSRNPNLAKKINRLMKVYDEETFRIQYSR